MGDPFILIRKGTRIDKLINVCWDLNENNEKRELSGLCEAMDRFDVADAEIIISGYDDRVEFKGKKSSSAIFSIGSSKEIDRARQVRSTAICIPGTGKSAS